MRVLGVIPVRMGATRFPGKPLVELAGRPIVQWVYDAAAASPSLDEVIVATPDDEIAARVRQFGGTVELTRPDHGTGTDRVAEVATRHPDADVVVNVQGDQPFVTSEMLADLVRPYADGERPVMTTLGSPIDRDTQLNDPDAVKVVCDRRGDALYFSRSPIPWVRADVEVPLFHHLGLYAFTSGFLATYWSLLPTPLEQAEGLEQLRVLEHGYRIRVVPTAGRAIEINSPSDLRAAEAFLARRAS